MTKAKHKPKPKKAGNLRGRFVDEYMIDQNATQAAIRAGYSPRSAGMQGGRLMQNDEILAEINRRAALISASKGITAERVIQEYINLALLDPLDLFNPDGSMKRLEDIPEGARRAIGGLELRELAPMDTPVGQISVTLRKVKLIDKRGALDSLAKIMGLMREKVDVSLNGNISAGVLLVPAAIDPDTWDAVVQKSQAELKGEKA